MVIAERWWADALREATRVHAFSAKDALVLSDGYRATVALPSARLVARVARDGQGLDGLQAEIDFALLAAGHDLPVLAPAEPLVTPTHHGAVSFWPLLSGTGARAGWSWLARVLARIHELPAGGYPHQCDPLGRIRNRLDRYRAWPGADEAAAEQVESACRQLSAELNEMTGPASIVHGDPHPGNVVVTAQGPVLVDFDLAGVGLASWDLTVAFVHHRRFGLPGRTLSAALRAYGADPRRHPGFDTMARLQELLCLSYVLERLLAGASADGELAIRLKALRAPGQQIRWHAIPPAIP